MREWLPITMLTKIDFVGKWVPDFRDCRAIIAAKTSNDCMVIENSEQLDIEIMNMLRKNELLCSLRSMMDKSPLGPEPSWFQVEDGRIVCHREVKAVKIRFAGEKDFYLLVREELLEGL